MFGFRRSPRQHFVFIESMFRGSARGQDSKPRDTETQRSQGRNQTGGRLVNEPTIKRPPRRHEDVTTNAFVRFVARRSRSGYLVRAEMTELTVSHGETKQRRRAEESGSTGRLAVQAGWRGRTRTDTRARLNTTRFVYPFDPVTRVASRRPPNRDHAARRSLRVAAVFSVRLRCSVPPC